jgi:uncharacterized membrane protein YqhA
MRILWHNTVTFLLLIVAFVLLYKCWPEITATLATMKNIGPGHTTEEKTIGLLALGLVAAFLLGVVKILTQGPKQ